MCIVFFAPDLAGLVALTDFVRRAVITTFLARDTSLNSTTGRGSNQFPFPVHIAAQIAGLDARNPSLFAKCAGSVIARNLSPFALLDPPPVALGISP